MLYWPVLSGLHRGTERAAPQSRHGKGGSRSRGSEPFT